tara:strand:- start:15690 stop:16424 length:735 start_codon:yes stop_codon:yes gene_type:complete
MKKLILVINDHAEVGKTSTSSALAGYLKSQGIKSTYVGIVGNSGESGADEANYDATWNIIEDSKLKRLYGFFEGVDAVVFDVETGNSAAFVDLYEKHDLDMELGEMDIDLTIVTPEVEEAACHEELIHLTDIFSDKADYIVARVPLDEFSSRLEAWEDSEASDVMDYLGAAVVEIPRVTDDMQETLDSHGLSIANAISGSIDVLPDTVAEVMEAWKRDFNLHIEEAVDFLHAGYGRRGLKLAAG